MRTGIDIIEINRIAKATGNESFLRRVFTEAERRYCESRGKQCHASMAGIYAAKEAFLKALGTGLRFGSWQDVVVYRDEWGAPYISCTGEFARIMREQGMTSVSVSISHCREYAVAHVIIS